MSLKAALQPKAGSQWENVPVSQHFSWNNCGMSYVASQFSREPDLQLLSGNGLGIKPLLASLPSLTHSLTFLPGFLRPPFKETTRI